MVIVLAVTTILSQDDVQVELSLSAGSIHPLETKLTSSYVPIREAPLLSSSLHDEKAQEIKKINPSILVYFSIKVGFIRIIR